MKKYYHLNSKTVIAFLMLISVNVHSQTYQINRMKMTKNDISQGIQKAKENDYIEVKVNAEIIILSIDGFPFRYLKILKSNKIDDTELNGTAYLCETNNDNGILTYVLFHITTSKTFLLRSENKDKSINMYFYYD